jgi:hypothetical protein
MIARFPDLEQPRVTATLVQNTERRQTKQKSQHKTEKIRTPLPQINKTGKKLKN